MGKVKSAIITTLVALVLLVVTLFATVSCIVPGSNGVKRYNSFLSSITMGSEFTGDASTVLLPEGVITASDYRFDAANQSKYTLLADSNGKYYVESGKYVDVDLGAKVAEDAKLITERLAIKGYSSYSVSVMDKFAIQIAVPMSIPFSSYKGYDDSKISARLSEVTSTITNVSYEGGLSIRHASIGYDDAISREVGSKSLIDQKHTVTDYIKNAKVYALGGNTAVQINFTKAGREWFAEKSAQVAASETKNISFYIGDNELIPLTVDSTYDNNSLYITTSTGISIAQDYATTIDTAIHGKTVSLAYVADEVLHSESAYGTNVAIFVLVAFIVAFVAICVASIILYKKLGVVNALMLWAELLVLVCSAVVMGYEVTLFGVITAFLTIVLLAFTNMFMFEKVREGVKAGKVVQAAVKDSYKKNVMSVLDLHIVTIIAGALLALICVGEMSACGTILLVGSIASYVLYWFTRFMWYVMSAPQRDKFKFCGFKREVYEDD